MRRGAPINSGTGDALRCARPARLLMDVLDQIEL